MMATPSSRALSSFDPASAPATVVGLLADRSGNLAASIFDQLLGFVARMTLQGSGENEGLASQGRRALFLLAFEGETFFLQPLNQRHVLGLVEKFADRRPKPAGQSRSTSCSSSSLAFISASIEPKASARNCAVRSPTKRIPSP